MKQAFAIRYGHAATTGHLGLAVSGKRVTWAGRHAPIALSVQVERTSSTGQPSLSGCAVRPGCTSEARHRALIAIMTILCTAMLLLPAYPAYAEEAEGTDASSGAGSDAEPSTEVETDAGVPEGDGSSNGSSTEGANVGVATECTVAELAAVYEDMDGAVVKVTGEVVGEAIPADDGEHTWISISQDGTAMSVYMSDADAETIQHFGSYGEIGDTITVEGIYHVDCSSHDGDLDIHVTSMTLDDEGSASVAEIDTTRLYVAVAVVAVGLALGFVYWRLKERQR